MNIADPSDRELNFASGFFEHLDQIGYSDFSVDNTKKATEIMCKYLLPQKLRDVMSDRIELDKALKKDVKKFAKLARNEANSCQTYYSFSPLTDKKQGKHDNTNRGAGSSGKGKFQGDKNTNLRVCLLPPQQKRGIIHLLYDCRANPENEKVDLLEKFKAE